MINATWEGPTGLTPFGFKKEGDPLTLTEKEFAKLKSEGLATKTKKSVKIKKEVK